MTTNLPIFPAEDHRCDPCDLSYRDLSHGEALVRIQRACVDIRQLVMGCDQARLTVREPDCWSISEYLCHVRDVFIASTVRLHRARTEENPKLDPMLNKLRAERFRYNEWPTAVVLDEIDATSTGFIQEARLLMPSDFDCVATGPMGDRRTALWFVRHALHEAVHHRADIEQLTRVGTDIA